MITGVACLYIDPRGPYPALVGPDMCWDEARDARTYAGPWPVVAHPPCGPWGALKHFSRFQDPTCGLRAIEQVRAFGGVIEQPKGSGLFHAALVPWSHLVKVDQVAWGHCARKETWLYFVGVPLGDVLTSVRVGGEPTHWVSGGRKLRTGRGGGVVPPGIKVCSAQQRRRTPVAFAEWLLTLAAQAQAPKPRDGER